MTHILVGLWSAAVWLRPLVSDAVSPAFHLATQLALIGFSLLLCWARPAPAGVPPRTVWALGWFLGVSLLALLASPHRAPAAGTWLDVAAGAVLIPAVARLESGQAWRLVTGLLAIGVLIGAFALLQWFLILPVLATVPADAAAVQEVAARGRVFGTFPLPTLLAGFLAMLLPLAAWRVVGAAGGRRAVAVGALAVGTLALLAAQSLAALGALFLACAVVMLRQGRQPRHRWVAWVFIGGALLAGLCAARPSLMRFTDAHHPLRHRLAYWRVTASVIRRHPLRGVGLGGFEAAYRAARPAGVPLVRHAHNSYLELWAEWGVLGVLAWSWLVWEILSAAPRRSALLAVGVWAFALHNLVDAPLYAAQVNVLWWLLAALALKPKEPGSF